MFVHYLEFLVVVIVSTVHGIHNGRLLCSHCHGHTEKQQCNNFQLCHSGEQCFTTTYTINGLTRLFTGCMPESDCSTLGFTFVDQKGQLPPGSAIVHQQCCNTDGCNGLQGSADRTACMSCSEDEKTALQCQHAVLCSPEQECMYYQFMETSNYQTRIRLSCVNHEVCEMLRSQLAVFGKREELAMKKHCCKTDYCNIFWDQTPLNSSNPQTTKRTTTSPTTTAETSTTTATDTTLMTTRATTNKITTLTTAFTTSTTIGQHTHITLTNKPLPSKTLVTLTNPHTTHVQHTHSTQGPNTTTTQKQTHTPEQHTPTLEQHTPTPEQHTPTPGQHTPTPEQHTPTPGQHTPTPEQHTPTPEQHTPTPEQHIPTPEQHIPTTAPLHTVTPSTLVVPGTQTPVITQPTTSKTTTSTVLTTTTQPPANKCYSSSKDSSSQIIIGCPDEAPYCLNNVTNYGNGKTTVAKGCATAAQCYWVPKESSSFYCDRYTSSHVYFADFMCFYCCTGELCNVDAVASPESPFHPTVIPPNPITHPTVTSNECYVCDDCHGTGTLSTCSGNTPYCLNHYTNSQWGVSHISKRCGTKQECHDLYYEGSRYQLLCSLFDEHVSENMRLDCHFCCTTPHCNEHARPPPETLYKE